MPKLAVVAAVGALWLLATAAPATAGPGLEVGAVEDDLRASTLVEAQARMTLFRLTGFRAARVTTFWTPGLIAPSEGELRALGNVATAAELNGVHLYVTVMNPGSRTTPLTDEARSEFASYAAALVKAVPAIRHVIVGNEPNLNRFWLPQFGLDGSSASPAAYLSLLARTYDAVKAVSAEVEVLGGAVSPRGTDRADGMRPTHSPTTFIPALGEAYRASGRTLPVMDAFVQHVYGDHSSQAPTVAHPNGTSIGVADYEKLVALLGEAFDGTAQRGSTLPIVYGEYGVETEIPTSKAGLYTGTEPSTTRPTTEPNQAAFYAQALALAFCQPNVEAMLVFHAQDERERAGWQSGVRYVDGTAKSSLRARDRGARSHDRRLDHTLPGSPARGPGSGRPLRLARRGAARDLPSRVHVRPRLRLRRPGRQGRRRDEDGEARPGGGGRRGQRRLPAPPPRPGDVSVPPEARPPGEPRSADRARRAGLPPAVVQ